MTRAMAAAAFGWMALTLACGGGSAGSAPAPAPRVTPTIATQPTDQTGTYGASASFTLSATGSPAPGFQWRRNGQEIVGATAATLTVDPVRFEDEGARFDVIVHNDLGYVVSAAATLHVQNTPGHFLVTFVTTQAGTLTGTTYQSVPAGGSTSAVSAVPTTAVHPPNPWANYSSDTAFHHWSGTGAFTSTDNPLLLTDIQSDLTLQANYTGGKAGCMMTEITGIDATGADAALSADQGSVLLLDISKGDNPFSQANAPILEALYRKYRDQGLKVVTVLPMDDQYSTPSQTFLQGWVDTYGLTFKVMNDTTLGTPWGGAATEVYGNAAGYGLPVIVIFDKAGVIQFSQAGFDPTAVEAKVAELLAR
ncbi:MAG TPA: immunoglobulin domain-containing protein [Holophagaceae bacterium]|nr:immunoglobulin domain-containing protein [Holophagaceae bacterium]